jgi:DNA modification methylase
MAENAANLDYKSEQSQARTVAGKIPVYCAYDKLVNPIDIIGNPRNPNQHPKEQIKLLAHIIQSQGWRTPITVSTRSGYIVRGHGRLEAALTFGAELVPIDYQNYATEAEEWADLIADNRIAELAVINEAQLTELLAELAQESAGIDVELTGYTAEQIADLIEKHTDNSAAARAAATLTLQQRFIVAPFSVMDARAGVWAERKRAWRDLGIKSEIGRGNDGDKTESGLTYARSSQPAQTYNAKNAYEMKIGKKIEWEEFARLFPDEMIHRGTSVFDPVLCEVVYRWFCPQGGSVIDPFAGGSVRGIVAALTGRNYTGIDLSARQIAANTENWEELKDTTIEADDAPASGGAEERAPKWINGDSVNIQTLAPGEYDLLFTCPPYADLEVYSDAPEDISNKPYPEFLKLYRDIIARAAALLKPNRFACVVVGEVRDDSGNYYNFVGDTIRAFIDAGLAYYNEAILITPYGGLTMRAGKQFKNSRKLGKTHQNILMFHNGNPDETGLFDYSKPELAEADIQNYLAQTKGRLGKHHANVLVFSNGDPEQASDDIGVPETPEDLIDMDNSEALNRMLGIGQPEEGGADDGDN